MANELNTMDALRLWHHVGCRSARELPGDLSVRQMNILTTVYLEPGPHSVKSLSESLDISKAAICRALDILSIAGFLKRKKDPNNKRIVTIQRTVQGSVFLSDYADIIMQCMEEAKTQSDSKKESAYS